MTNLFLYIILICLTGALAVEANENRRLRRAMAARVDAMGFKPTSEKLFDY